MQSVQKFAIVISDTSYMGASFYSKIEREVMKMHKNESFWQDVIHLLFLVIYGLLLILIFN